MTESRTRGLEDSPTDRGSSTVSSTICYPQDTQHITADDLFQALSNSRRRHVIRALEDGERDIGALARAIAAVECDIAVDQIDSQQRKRVYIGLYQTHLDQLERWDIVEWDTNHQMVAPGPCPRRCPRGDARRRRRKRGRRRGRRRSR